MLFEGLGHVARPGQMRSDKMRLEGEPASQDQRQGLGNASTSLAAGTVKFKAKSLGTEREKDLGPIIKFTSEVHHYHILLRIKKKKIGDFKLFENNYRFKKMKIVITLLFL